MLVCDVRHYLDMPEDAPGPARRLAVQLPLLPRSLARALAKALAEDKADLDCGAYARSLPPRDPHPRRCRTRLMTHHEVLGVASNRAVSTRTEISSPAFAATRRSTAEIHREAMEIAGGAGHHAGTYWPTTDETSLTDRRVRVWVPWKGMIVGSLILTVVVNLVRWIA